MYLQAAAQLLEEHWEPSIQGRTNDVPKPEITIGGEVSQSDLKTKDHARIVDGGDQSITPQGFGWTHEAIEAQVTIELRSADRRVRGDFEKGRTRMFGEYYGSTSHYSGSYSLPYTGNGSERYGGLAGEVKRILDAHRKGYDTFDLVVATPFRDESAAEGQKVHRADVDVAFITEASPIDPSI